MGREKLHWFRLLTPGALAAFFCLTLFNPSLDLTTFATVLKQWQGVVIIVCLLLGYPYRAFDVRRLFLRDFWETVNRNIEDQLLAIARRRLVISLDQETYLRDDRRLMDVFYRSVDNDESLKAKVAGIYFNGYLTTLGVDIVTVSGLAAIAHGIAWIMVGGSLHITWTLICLSLMPLAWVTFRQSIKRHLALSNEQLRYIGNFNADKVCKSVEAVLRNMPSESARPNGITN